MSTQASVKKVIESSQETVKHVDSSPETYLTSKGWVKFDHLWYDPQKPMKATETKEKVMDRLLPDGRTEPVYQMRITPAQWPVTIQEALATQKARDAEGK